MMLHAMDAFTEPGEKNEDKRYWKGIRVLCDEVFPEDTDWLAELAPSSARQKLGTNLNQLLDLRVKTEMALARLHTNVGNNTFSNALSCGNK